MSETNLVILILAIGTLTVRLAGVAVGQKLPRHGAWARGLNALPGCMIVSLVMVVLSAGGPKEWLAALAALGVAIVSNNLPVTMLVGILSIWLLRHYA
jgi:uncharacterized membrane protein